MPLREYKCEDCECVEEKLVKGNPTYQQCTECGGVSEKIISICSFQLKEGGTCSWGRNGYISTKDKEG